MRLLFYLGIITNICICSLSLFNFFVLSKKKQKKHFFPLTLPFPSSIFISIPQSIQIQQTFRVSRHLSKGHLCIKPENSKPPKSSCKSSVLKTYDTRKIPVFVAVEEKKIEGLVINPSKVNYYLLQTKPSIF